MENIFEKLNDYFKPEKTYEMGAYNGYKICRNDNYNPSYPSTTYEFYSIIDCDEPMGNGSSLTDCKIQIDERIFNRNVD
jgi:hypothetical protein